MTNHINQYLNCNAHKTNLRLSREREDFFIKNGKACFRVKAPRLGPQYSVIVTPSAKAPRTWQATLFNCNNPESDQLFEYHAYMRMLKWVQEHCGVELRAVQVKC